MYGQSAWSSHVVKRAQNADLQEPAGGCEAIGTKRRGADGRLRASHSGPLPPGCLSGWGRCPALTPAVSGVVLVGILMLMPPSAVWSQLSGAPSKRPAVSAKTTDKSPDAAPEKKLEQGRPKLPVAPTKDWRRLAKEYEVWLDRKHKAVVVGGEVCLRRGQLEMFACPIHTKEHESVVAVHTPARFVHAALLALGAKEGKPVRFDPKYEPAQGVTVDVDVLWRDSKGKLQRKPAQQWVKNIKTGKILRYSWVFVGSGFSKDATTGQQYYYADGGDFICVSNFPTATLDLPVESTQANDGLMFAPFTEHIPPRGTRVLLVLKPRLKPKPAKNAKSD